MSARVPAEVAAESRRSHRKWGIPASVTIAQWAVESGWGKFVTGKFNLGGITAKVKNATFPFEPGIPLEPATLCWTHEIYRGERVRCQRWFKDFETPSAFFEAHAALLATSPIYARARAKLPDVDAFVEQLQPVLDAKGKVLKPGYATDPNYAATLKAVIRGANLYAFDDLGTARAA